MEKFKDVSFDDIGKGAALLAERIMQEKGKPGRIVYIQRGGMVLARLLSDELGVSNMTPVVASHYKGVGEVEDEVAVGRIWEVNGDGYSLLVDDVADRGDTLKEVTGKLALVSKDEIVTCTLYMKPHSVFAPDFYAYSVPDDVWIIFPYEKSETRRSLNRTEASL